MHWTDAALDEDSCTIDVTQQLENLALDFLSQLCRSGSEEDSPRSEEVNSTRRPNVRLQLSDRTRTDDSGAYGVKYLTYPRKSSSGSAKPFAQFFKALNSMHEAVTEQMPATKRDIYYKDVTLFKTQRVVDTLVDDIAASLDVERSDLNVRATSKGTFCGSALVIHLLSEESIHGNDTEASLIPVGEDIASFSADEGLSWVLIVEKDAVFQTLCRLKLTNHPSLPGKGLLITGKGYPDMATRHLVNTLSQCLPQSIPIMALVDGDAYGLDILSVYKYGSARLQHENEKLAAARIKWLGLWSSELAGLDIDRDSLIPITKHDEKKALAMLQRPQTQMPAKWRKELMHMIHNRRKAEIEILSTASNEIYARKQSESPALPLKAWRSGRNDMVDQGPETGAPNLYLPIDFQDFPDDEKYVIPSTQDANSKTLEASLLPSRPSSSSFHSSNSSRSETVSPRSPLLHYLVLKISNLVASAQLRAAAAAASDTQ